jgi:RNA polymerase sigma factor (TIGR02999 family)
MAGPAAAEVTALLKAWGEGHKDALDRLTPIVMTELKRIARRQMRAERGEHTLQATALVNEVYLRLVDVTGIRWVDRAHFFAICARIMRRILVEAARARLAGRRAGGALRVSFCEDLPVLNRAADFVALDDALTALGAFDERKARMIELRFFGGLSVEETAGVLNISEQSVHRDWRLARSWLMRELNRSKSSSHRTLRRPSSHGDSPARNR